MELPLGHKGLQRARTACDQAHIVDLIQCFDQAQLGLRGQLGYLVEKQTAP